MDVAELGVQQYSSSCKVRWSIVGQLSGGTGQKKEQIVPGGDAELYDLAGRGVVQNSHHKKYTFSAYYFVLWEYYI